MTGSAITLIQNLIGTPATTVQTIEGGTVTNCVAVYDVQYITGAIILILTISFIYKLLLVFAKGLGRLKND